MTVRDWHCPPWCIETPAGHQSDARTGRGFHHDGDSVSVILADDGESVFDSGKQLFVKPAQYVAVSNKGAAPWSPHVEIQGERCVVATMSPEHARELSEALLLAAKRVEGSL